MKSQQKATTAPLSSRGVSTSSNIKRPQQQQQQHKPTHKQVKASTPGVHRAPATSSSPSHTPTKHQHKPAVAHTPAAPSPQRSTAHTHNAAAARQPRRHQPAARGKPQTDVVPPASVPAGIIPRSSMFNMLLFILVYCLLFIFD